MSDVITDAVKSTIFGARRADKVTKSDLSSAPVAAGQLRNAVNSIMTLDNSIGKGTKAAVDTFHKICANKPVMQYVGKGVDFASKHVNSLICVSGGIKVLTADDKVSAGIEQGSAMVSMFAAEGLMKDHLHTLPSRMGLGNIAKKVVKFSAETPGMKALPAVIKGLAFVIGSTAAYVAGEKAGKFVTSNINS